MMKIKTIQQVTSQSLKDAVKTAYGRGGVRNFYAGFGVHVLCEGPGRGETVLLEMFEANPCFI